MQVLQHNTTSIKHGAMPVLLHHARSCNIVLQHMGKSCQVLQHGHIGGHASLATSMQMPVLQHCARSCNIVPSLQGLQHPWVCLVAWGQCKSCNIHATRHARSCNIDATFVTPTSNRTYEEQSCCRKHWREWFHWLECWLFSREFRRGSMPCTCDTPGQNAAMFADSAMTVVHLTRCGFGGHHMHSLLCELVE